MKLRYKVLAVIMAYLKPVLVPVMNWYAKRKMRKEMEKMQEKMMKSQNVCHMETETVERKKGDDLSDLFFGSGDKE